MKIVVFRAAFAWLALSAAPLMAQENGTAAPRSISREEATSLDIRAWQKIETSTAPDDYVSFLQAFPNSIHRADAEARLRLLERLQVLRPNVDRQLTERARGQ